MLWTSRVKILQGLPGVNLMCDKASRHYPCGPWRSLTSISAPVAWAEVWMSPWTSTPIYSSSCKDGLQEQQGCASQCTSTTVTNIPKFILTAISRLKVRWRSQSSDITFKANGHSTDASCGKVGQGYQVTDLSCPNYITYPNAFWGLHQGQRSNAGQSHMTFVDNVRGHQLWWASVNKEWPGRPK